MEYEMQETVEELDEQLDEALKKIDEIAALVAEGDKEVYEGFMETEQYKNKIVEIGHKLKDMGVDISTRSV